MENSRSSLCESPNGTRTMKLNSLDDDAPTRKTLRLKRSSGEEYADSEDDNRPTSPMLPSAVFADRTRSAPEVSSTDSRMWRTQRRSLAQTASPLPLCRSAPLLAASQSPLTSTWHSSSHGFSSSGRSLWRPLGSTWRDWQADEFGDPLRKNVDDGSAFVHGCVPHWSKQSTMRKHHVLEHELTWAYYRMSRHSSHPQRKEVGDPHLPQADVVEAMRHGRDNRFQFWRDLRPPFQVMEVNRLVNEPGAGSHPDGDLFEVVFQCGIDYVSERLWGQKSDAGTFSNKAVTSTRVRIPNGYPCQRPITIVSWGKPTLNWNPHHEKDDDGNLLKPIVVDPNKWMPISDELKQRADHPRFAGCREAIKRAKSHRPIEVEPLQKLLLGPHCTLTKTAKLSKLHDKANSTGMLDATPGKKVKKRAHCIFTSAAGFVRYAG